MGALLFSPRYKYNLHMSTDRISKEAGFCSPRHLPKGPNGRALCRECNEEVPAGRRSFCSSACVHEWQCRTNPTYQRQQVKKRDKGICAECSLDCLAEEAEMRRLLSLTGWNYQHYCRSKQTYITITLDEKVQAEIDLKELRKRNKASKSRRSLWDMDHNKPVVEGGGECGLDNLRTLCIPCHKKATKDLAARRAVQRKKDKLDAASPLNKFKDGE